MSKTTKKELSPKQSEELIKTLKGRFEKNTKRHERLAWAKVLERLEANPGKLWSLAQMEETGGEPDVVAFDKKTGEVTFFDCAEETPKGRRSLCYDDEALAARKEHKPQGSAVGTAEAMGAELLTVEQYHELQKFGPVDTKTSSWVKTPDAIRNLDGALFGDFRYGQTFIYHNGASSYYGARAFRVSLRV